LERILLLFLEQAWLAMLVCVSFTPMKVRPIIIGVAIFCIDLMIKNKFLAPAHFSGTALLINILGNLISIGVWIVYRKKNPYYLLQTVSLVEAVSLAARVMIK